MANDPSEILRASALTQATLLRRRALSSEELVRLYLGRIERHGPRLGAFVCVLTDRALRHARACDRALKRGGELPPFCGVPIGIKDLNFVRGVTTRLGSRGFRLWSPVDDRTVSCLRRGGFVILGKLATSELGALPVTEPQIHPPTRNPWQLSHSAGGSSGGSAAAVSAALLPVAQASDGAGSIRIPAAFCHLYGIKPSRGRVANAYGQSDRDLLYTDGPITRSVDDAAALLDLMAGITFGRRHWAPAPSRPFVELCREPPGRLQVRLLRRSTLGPVDGEVDAALDRAARALADRGHVIEERDPPVAELKGFLPLWQHLVASVPFVRWSKVEPVTRWLRDAGVKVRRAEADALRRRLSEHLLNWFGDADLLLSPTTPAPAPPIGAFASLPPEEAFHAAAQLGAFTAFANITGQPAASVPLGLSAAGLPIGVQLVGRPFADAVVLAVSRELEEALPWKDRLAPLALSPS